MCSGSGAEKSLGDSETKSLVVGSFGMAENGFGSSKVKEWKPSILAERITMKETAAVQKIQIL